MKYLLILLTAVLVSCSSTKQANTVQEISFRTIKANNNSGYNEPTTLVISNETDFMKAWETVWMRFSDVPALPEINFEESQLAFIALGMKNNGGYTLEVEKVIEEKGSITIHYIENQPGEKCISTQAIVFPAVFVQIPKNTKKMVFKRSEKIVDCK